MDSKATLKGSAPVTPAISLHHDSPGESVEMKVFNQPQIDDVQLDLPKSATVNDDPAAIRREMIAMASVCWSQFMAGWNDGTLGPLIPVIQRHFDIGFMTVSMLFVSACGGFVTGGVTVIYLTDRFGFGRVLIAGSLCQIVANAILSTTPPFPLMCATLVINGIGTGFQNAQTSAMVASLTRNPGMKMGLLHAAYGAGACISPLISTQFTQIPRWSFYFLVALGLAISNNIFQLLVFGFRTLPEVLASFGIPEVVHTADATRTNKYRQILSLKIIYVLAFFSLLYVGTEVTIGGWIVTFLIENRGGGTSTGYVSSGFFAGLMLGRLVLIWVNQKIGERRAVYLYSCIVIGLEFFIWFTPSLVLNAVAVSFVGLLLVTLLLGPFYPILMRQTSGLLPAWLLTGAIGCIASSGMTGSAIFPFITGVVAQKQGVQVLQPLIVSLLGLIIITWALIPRIGKKGD